MSFILNNYQQIAFFDSLGFLSERKQKILDKSWVKSMMIEFSIRKTGRLELLYTCLANLVHEILRNGQSELLERLHDYEDTNHRNRVDYHDQSIPQDDLSLSKVVNKLLS